MEKYKLTTKLDIEIPGDAPTSSVFTADGGDLKALLKNLMAWARGVYDDLPLVERTEATPQSAETGMNILAATDKQFCAHSYDEAAVLLNNGKTPEEIAAFVATQDTELRVAFQLGVTYLAMRQVKSVREEPSDN